LDLLLELLVGATPALEPFVVGTVAVARGPAGERVLVPVFAPLVPAPRRDAGLWPGRRRDRAPARTLEVRAPDRADAVAVLEIVVRAAVPPATDVAVAPFELELVLGVEAGTDLPGLVGAATPQRAAGVAHPEAVESGAVRRLVGGAV